MAGTTFQVETYPLIAGVVSGDAAALSSTSGVTADHAQELWCIASAPDGETITGGAMQAWCYLATGIQTASKGISGARWMRAPDMDFVPSPGLREMAKAVAPVASQGRVCFIPMALTCSSATGNVSIFTGVRRRGT